MTTDELALQMADQFETFAHQLRKAVAPTSGAADIAPTTVPTHGEKSKGEGAASSLPLAANGRTASWVHVQDLSGQTYTWPPKELDTYDPFRVFETVDGIGTVRIGIGYADQATIDASRDKRPYLVTFEVVGLAKRRTIVVFTATDDSDKTGDFVGPIKGKGQRGTEMFSPGDVLPPAYADLEVVTFRDEVTRRYSYNKLAVAARGGNVDPILDHALIQLRLRFS